MVMKLMTAVKMKHMTLTLSMMVMKLTTAVKMKHDSDATTLDLEITPRSSTQFNVGASGENSTSFESVYETDPDYSAPPPQSQPCQKHGVSYVPAGMRRKLIKKEAKLR